MKSLDIKLLRDLWGMKSQALAIAFIIMSGVATFVMSLSTLDSLIATRDTYYTDYRFAEVFATVKRAPDNIGARVLEIPGVEAMETRVVAPVNVEIEGFADPVIGEIISVPGGGQPLFNRLYLRQGRFVETGRTDEVVLSDAFAEAHGLAPGDRLSVVIKGKKKRLTIVGIALSPEYIYQIGPGAIFPDFKRFGVLWMEREPLSTAYDMDGAFNNVVLSISPGANEEEVIERLDRVLEPYGGLGAYGRADQISNHFLTEDLDQLTTTATFFPFIFIAVAVFLLNIVVARMVATQREQIAILKAFGYTNTAIWAHYTKLILMIVALGVAMGIVAGVWMGKGMSNVYMAFYRFPFIHYMLRPPVAVLAVLITSAAALAGTAFAVRRAALLPPATAMRPEPPTVYRETFLERLGIKRVLSQPSRMIARHIERRPVKSMLTVVGIALACGIMMVGRFQEDSVDFMIDVQYSMSQRQDLTVTFVEPTSRKALFELAGLRGVIHAEDFRSVPVRLRYEHRSHRTSILGVDPGSELHRVLDTDLERIDVPAEGVVLTDYLGQLLGVKTGDMLTVEVLEGSRPVRRVPVAGLSKQYMGLRGYMEKGALNRFMREGDAISGAYLTVDGRYRDEIFAEIKEMPRVAGTVIKRSAIDAFYETLSETILFFTFISTLLGGTIAFGVVYNNAVIALSERSRELASLRVLGFTRAEISYILLGEMAVLTLAAVPLGFVFGRLMCGYLATRLESELYRVPLILEVDTYAFAATVVIVSAVISALIVRSKLDRLDLIGVLKTKE